MYAYAYNDPMNVIDPSGMNGARVAGMLGEEIVIEVAIQVATGQPIDLTTATRSAAEGIVNPLKKVERIVNLVKTYQTYTKTHLGAGKVYSGRTSGTKDPDTNVANRDKKHHKTKEGYGPAVLDKTSPKYEEIRGREQELIDANGGAQSTGGTSGNTVNGISSTNSNRDKYEEANRNAVWRNCDGALSVDCNK